MLRVARDRTLPSAWKRRSQLVFGTKAAQREGSDAWSGPSFGASSWERRSRSIWLLSTAEPIVRPSRERVRWERQEREMTRTENVL